MTTDELIGANVHSLMWSRHVKRDEMASALGLTTRTLAGKMRGRIAWSADDIAAAAQLLEVDPGRLFNRLTIGLGIRRILAVAA